MDDIKPNEWINCRRAFGASIPRKREEPKFDAGIAKATGIKVKVNDPRLIKKVVEWRKGKDPEQQDFYLRDPQKVDELRKIFRNG